MDWTSYSSELVTWVFSPDNDRNSATVGVPSRAWKIITTTSPAPVIDEAVPSSLVGELAFQLYGWTLWERFAKKTESRELHAETKFVVMRRESRRDDGRPQEFDDQGSEASFSLPWLGNQANSMADCAWSRWFTV